MEFDVVIVGGGLVGASLACALENTHLKVALIDKAPLRTEKPQNAFARALALSATSVQHLQTLQVWSEVSSRATPIKTVHVSKQGHFGATCLDAVAQRVDSLGQVMDADELNLALSNRIQSVKNLTLFPSEQIEQLSKQDGWSITLKSGKAISAALLVAADGSYSSLREQQGITATTIDYDQIAVTCNISLNQSHDNVAYERFLDTGTIALLPFGDKRVKCIWIAPAQDVEHAMSFTAPLYLETMQRYFGYRLGEFVAIDKRITYPVKSIFASALYDHGIVLIGNAANTLTPVAAQGFNLGLRDAMELAAVLGVIEQSKIGSIACLSHYAESRYSDQQKTRTFTQYLNKPTLFQTLGILACEFLPSVKNKVMRTGMGVE